MVNSLIMSEKGSFWWRDILNLLNEFKSFSSAQVQDGSTCLFWWDKWIQQALHLEYPELFSFAKNKEICVAKALLVQNLSDLFHLPLSLEAFNQLQVLQSFRDHFPLTNSQDIWNSQWGTFSVKRTYNYLLGHRQVPNAFKWLWECFCQPKHKVFFWLLLKDRLSTRSILRRKNMHLESYNCVLC